MRQTAKNRPHQSGESAGESVPRQPVAPRTYAGEIDQAHESPFCGHKKAEPSQVRLMCSKTVCWLCRVPKSELGLPARMQPGIFLAIGMIPSQQLIAGGIVLAGIEQPQQRRAGEAAGAEIENEINQRVGPPLRERHFDQAGHLGHRGLHVALEERTGSVLCNARWKRLMRNELVPITDRRMPGHVKVYMTPEPLKPFNQEKSSIGNIHFCTVAFRNTWCYIVFVIKTFRHRGLEKFFLTGSKAGIQPKHAIRLRIQLTTLNLASRPEDMDRSGWKFHPLKGDLKDHYAITVNGNWRMTFRFEGEDAILVDYQDYH